MELLYSSWLWLLLAGLVVGALVATYRYRLHHVREMERTRMRIARDLHDDLGSRMSTLALRADLLSRRRNLQVADQAALADLAHEARELVDDLRHLVWLVNSGSDSLPDLIDRLEIVAGQMLENQTHHVDVPGDIPDVTLDAARRRHLLMIYRESLHNALRHSEAEQINVSVTLDGGALHLCVADDGEGFEEDQVDHGHGLTSMRDRARQLGAELGIDTAPGHGTAVHLAAKII